MAKYQIWDKESTIYTPSGATFTAEQWKTKYAWINIPGAVPIISSGIINGAFIGELNQMKELYSNQGCRFTDDMTVEEILAVIEAFEDGQNRPSSAPTQEERQTAALEAIAAGQTTDNAAALNILLGEGGE